MPCPCRCAGLWGVGRAHACIFLLVARVGPRCQGLLRSPVASLGRGLIVRVAGNVLSVTGLAFLAVEPRSASAGLPAAALPSANALSVPTGESAPICVPF